MKLPSLEYLGQHAVASFLRFPLTLLSALVAVVMGIYMVECEDTIDNVFPFVNTLLCAALGIALFFCTAVVAEKRKWNAYIRWALQGLSALLLLGIYFTLPSADVTQNTSVPYIRYAIYNITIHLLVSFVPFIGHRQLNGFWNYNKILFIRFWTSVLYSAFLYVGLILALVALNLLFDVEIHDKLYFDIYISILGFFNTWFFVAGIPKDFDALDALEEYPKGLKVFAQYILLPLLVLYLLILYGYGLKIVGLWDWPKGIVSYLIACVSVLGILTVLLLHPYAKIKDNGWIKKLSRGYYLVLLPLIVILFIAIGMRIGDYGITINRYVIVLLGIWLTMVSLYFAFGKTNIKFVPTSLGIILVLMSFGPWSMFSVSEQSQAHRLQAILEQVKILQEEHVQQEVIWIKDSLPHFHSALAETNEGLLADSLHNEVASILDYLDSHHGFSAIKGWYAQDLDVMIKSANKGKARWNKENEAEVYMRTLGLKYEYRDMHSNTLYFSLNTAREELIHIKGYDYFIPFDQYAYDKTTTLCSFTIDSIPYKLNYSPDKKKRLILDSDQEHIAFDIQSLSDQLLRSCGKKETEGIAHEQMKLIGSAARFDVTVEFKRMGFDGPADSLKLNSLSGNLFITLKTNKTP
jgi:hypothetical protein